MYTYSFKRYDIEQDMEEGIEDDETNEEIEIRICLGPLVRNQGHNGVPSRDQVVKYHAI